MHRNLRRAAAKANDKRSTRLTMVPREQWPDTKHDPKRIAVYLSRFYLVQVFQEDGAKRITVNRTTVSAAGWEQNIAWEELQEVKREIGMGDLYAIEVYPRDRDIVNVANMRHLWVLDSPLQYGWFSK